MTHPTTQYALEAVNGQRVVGQLELQACQRHLDDLERQGTPDFPYIFDETKANRIFKWFRYTPHIEGPLADAGENIELIEAHKFDMGCMFGWVNMHTGYRRFQRAYIQEGRKNAKTTRVSGVILYMVCGDKEPNPTVYCAAVDRSQAKLMFKIAKKMAMRSRHIRKRLKLNLYEMINIDKENSSYGGTVEILSKEKLNKDGLNPHLAAIDEYHAHSSSEIYDVIASAWGQRAQALMIIITTAGRNVDSACFREYEYCKSIITPDNDIENDRYFVMIRQLDKDDDEHDPANWIKANPLMASIPEGMATLQADHDEAFDRKEPEKIITWRVKRLNMWVHSPEETFMGEYMHRWDDLAIPREKFIEITRGMTCNVGVDLSKSIDLTATAHLFYLPDGRIFITARGFIPEESVIQHEKTDKVPYRYWADEDWVTVTEGNVTDYDYIEQYIIDCEKDHGWSLHELCYDPYNATQFSTNMWKRGYERVEVRQGPKTLSEPSKLFRELVAQGDLVHDGSPLLKWCVGNAVQKTDENENIRISKKNISDNKRVDLLTASINALVRLESLRDFVEFPDYVASDDFGF